ncbi:MAG: hypothetical protein JKY70_18695 [Mucilaginibacter sp.]|nr:hypothetical protein [Mucilaginibacter sp.]
MKAEDIIAVRRSIKPLHYTLAYYAIVIIVVTLFNILPGFKSEMCGPNLDLISIFLSFLGAIFLLLVNLIMLKMRGQLYLSSVVIHTLVVSACVIFLVVNK